MKTFRNQTFNWLQKRCHFFLKPTFNKKEYVFRANFPNIGPLFSNIAPTYTNFCWTFFLIFCILFSDLLLPPKVNLVAGFNRTHLALTSKHLAVEEAVKFARAKSVQNQRGVHSWLHPIHRRQALFETSAESRRLRELSSKLSKLDELLHQVSKQQSIFAQFIGAKFLIFSLIC